MNFSSSRPGQRSRPLQAVLILALSLALVALAPAAASAGTVVRNGTTDDQGTGFGTVLSILSLQDVGGTEYGNVTWTGSADSTTGSAKIGGGSVATQTRTVAELTAAGITATNMSIIFNINQEGASPTLHLRNFTVIGYKADGTIAFKSEFKYLDDPNKVAGVGVPLVPLGQGTGSAGYVFDVNGVDEGSLATFFADPNNRLGITITSDQSINTEANDGPDNFYVAARTGIQEIPEPASLALAGIGVMGMAGYGWRRRKQALATK